MFFLNKIKFFRSIKSVLKKAHSRAPLAEIESSRVAENSPAVELPPVNFSSFYLNNTSSNQQQNRRFLPEKKNSVCQNFLYNKTTTKNTNYGCSTIIPDLNKNNIRLDAIDLLEMERNNNNKLPANNETGKTYFFLNK